jgi:hypothetical protein
MAIPNIAFTNTHVGIVPLNHFADQMVVQLTVRDSGKYVVFGRVVITNWDGDPQNASARLTTHDQATELDRADVRIDSKSCAQSISLQGTLILPSKTENSIIDIRCSTYNGVAQEATLFAILVDDLK